MAELNDYTTAQLVDEISKRGDATIYGVPIRNALDKLYDLMNLDVQMYAVQVTCDDCGKTSCIESKTPTVSHWICAHCGVGHIVGYQH